MMTEKIRISNRENVFQNGKKTSCQCHQFDKNIGASIFIGNYFVPGWDATDEQIADYVESVTADSPKKFFWN